MAGNPSVRVGANLVFAPTLTTNDGYFHRSPATYKGIGLGFETIICVSYDGGLAPAANAAASRCYRLQALCS